MKASFFSLFLLLFSCQHQENPLRVWVRSLCILIEYKKNFSFFNILSSGKDDFVCLLKVVVCIYLLRLPNSMKATTQKKKIIKIELRLMLWVRVSRQPNSILIEKKKAIIIQTKHTYTHKNKIRNENITKNNNCRIFHLWIFVFFDSLAAGGCYFISFFTFSLLKRYANEWMMPNIGKNGQKQALKYFRLEAYKGTRIEKDPHIKVYTQTQWKRPKSHM